MPYTTLLENFDAALKAGGLVAGLKFLNDRVPHRVTAVYVIDGDMMRNVAVYDKAAPEGELSLDVVPIGNSFCQYVVRDGNFRTSDSAVDHRLDGNPFQGVVACYVGLPLTWNGADLFGTFCHLDFVPQDLSDDEFAFLVLAVRLLPRYIPHPAATPPA